MEGFKRLLKLQAKVKKEKNSQRNMGEKVEFRAGEIIARVRYVG